MTATLQSPMLAKLAQEMEQGDATALPRFLEHINQVGTPLLEPTGEGDTWVTFLWQAESPDDQVLLYGPPVVYDFPHTELKSLRDTSLLYKTIRMQPTLPMTYYFLVNDNYGDDWAARSQAVLCDPLNPHKTTAPPNPDSNHQTVSEASYWVFPERPRSPLLEPIAGREQGTLHTHRFASTALQNERHVWVYTPPAYDPHGTPYGLLLLHDGHSFTTIAPTPTILDNLIAEGRIPPMIAVFVNSAEARFQELGLNDAFVRMLAEELIPWVHTHYNVSTDRSQSVIGGTSMGALNALYTATRHPERFGNVLSQSGAYWFGHDLPNDPDWMMGYMRTYDGPPLRLYLNYGTHDGRRIQETNEMLLPVLEAKGYDVHFEIYAGGHDTLPWAETLVNGLLALVKSTTETF